MGRQRLKPLPSDLAAVCKRFEQWRATRVGRSRIPASLWDLAVSLAKSHSVYRVSKTLRVSYHGLKRRGGGPALAGEVHLSVRGA